jgi:hypothetical protein
VAEGQNIFRPGRDAKTNRELEVMNEVDPQTLCSHQRRYLLSFTNAAKRQQKPTRLLSLHQTCLTSLGMFVEGWIDPTIEERSNFAAFSIASLDFRVCSVA